MSTEATPATPEEFIEVINEIDDIIRKAPELRKSLYQPYQVLKEMGKNVAHSLEQYQSLAEVSTLINSSLEVDNVLEAVIDTIIQITGAERAYVMMRNSKDEEYTIRVARNWDKESISSSDVVFSSNVVSYAIKQLQAIITFNAQEDDRFQGSQSVATNVLRSIICVPIQLRGEVMGVLYADNRLTKGIFHTSMEPLMTAFANQVAVALANARQYERVKADLERAQHEVRQLLGKVDKRRIQHEVESITGTDYFKKLQEFGDDKE